MTIATGTFEIRMEAHAPNDASSPKIGRMHFEKDWTGDLEGHSEGEMLSVGDPASGTATYVVLEVFTGALGGRTGSFAFRQSGDMHDGQAGLTYEVVPHSGSGDLVGLSGSLALEVVDGVHRYALTCNLTGAG